MNYRSIPIYMITVGASNGEVFRYEAVYENGKWWSIERSYDRRIMVTLEVLEVEGTGREIVIPNAESG